MSQIRRRQMALDPQLGGVCLGAGVCVGGCKSKRRVRMSNMKRLKAAEVEATFSTGRGGRIGGASLPLWYRLCLTCPTTASRDRSFWWILLHLRVLSKIPVLLCFVWVWFSSHHPNITQMSLKFGISMCFGTSFSMSAFTAVWKQTQM